MDIFHYLACDSCTGVYMSKLRHLTVSDTNSFWVPGPNLNLGHGFLPARTHTPTIPTGFWEFSSILTYLPGHSIRLYRLRAQSFKIVLYPPLQMPIISPRLFVTCACDPWAIRLEVPTTSSLYSSNMQEQLIKLRGTITLTN